MSLDTMPSGLGDLDLVQLTKSDKATGTTDINTASTTLVDMSQMEVTLTTRGGAVLVLFNAPVRADQAGRNVTVVIDIDGTDKIKTIVTSTAAWVFKNMSLVWLETLAKGSHTIKIQWKTSAGTAYQDSAGSYGERHLVVIELAR